MKKKADALMKTMSFAGWLLLLNIAWIVPGCSISTTPSEPTYYYTLDYQLKPFESSPPLPVVIRVDEFSVSPPYDSQKIIYADKGLHRNAYANHHWISPPGELMAYLIARDLRRSNRFQTILTPDSALAATHIVKGWIEEFLEEDTAEAWNASLCLHAILLLADKSDPSKRILFQNTYRAKTKAAEKTPAALAVAMSASAAQVSQALIEDIYRTLADKRITAP